MEPLDLTMWLLLYPAEDASGDWIAHWLDNDVVTQGTSPAHAWLMALEAQGIVLGHAVEAGQIPRMRRAPEADWHRLRDVLARGLRASDIGEVTSRTDAMAIALNVALQVSAADAPAVSTGIIAGASELHASAA